MYDADGTEEKKPDVQESYAGAVSAGNTRVEPHKVTRADLIASSGMSVHSTGTALMRLVSEWNSGAIPQLRDLPEVRELAQTMAAQRVEEDIRSEHADRGLEVSQKQAMREAVTVTRADMELAAAELARLHAQATDWHLDEAKLRFQRLKTLPTVRAALLYWVRERWPAESAEEWRDGEYLVAKVLQHFLSPCCPVCGGSGVREFAGNNRKGAGKPCQKCREQKVRGQLNVPCHGRGLALLAHIRSCIARAAKDVSEGAYRARRGEQSEEDRAKHKHHAKVDEQRRADGEAQADAEADTAGVAAHFRDSLGRKRPKG